MGEIKKCLYAYITKSDPPHKITNISKKYLVLLHVQGETPQKRKKKVCFGYLNRSTCSGLG